MPRRRPTQWERDMGERIKDLRERAGLTQAALAKKAGVPLGSLRCWEYAQRQPLLGAAVKLADALNITLDELAGRSPPAPPAAKRGKK
jgi:transcriptional regulator with XRE-family HTH domain